MFNRLQKIGKALMMPIAVLPIAAILLRLVLGNIHGGYCRYYEEFGGGDILKSRLIFAIGIALWGWQMMEMELQHLLCPEIWG